MIKFVPLPEDHEDLRGLDARQVAVLTVKANDYVAAAEELKIPLGTFKSRLHRARRAIIKNKAPEVPHAG